MGKQLKQMRIARHQNIGTEARRYEGTPCAHTYMHHNPFLCCVGSSPHPPQAAMARLKARVMARMAPMASMAVARILGARMAMAMATGMVMAGRAGKAKIVHNTFETCNRCWRRYDFLT